MNCHADNTAGAAASRPRRRGDRISLSQCGNWRSRNDAMGHSRHFGRSGPMSVLPPLATVIATCRKLTWEEIVAHYRLTLNQPAVNIEPSLMRRRTESLLLENGY